MWNLAKWIKSKQSSRGLPGAHSLCAESTQGVDKLQELLEFPKVETTKKHKK